MYILAFLTAYILAKKYLAKQEQPLLNKKQLEDLFLYGIVGLLLGARLFYVFVYGFSEFAGNPLSIIWPFQGGQFVGISGLSFHGGVIGGVIGVLVYCWRFKINFLAAADLMAMVIPFGYTWGRLGNFINGELYGRITAAGWGMLFPQATPVFTYHIWVQQIAEQIGMDITGDIFVNLPRYPSQLVQGFAEGLLVGLLLWFVIARFKKFNGMVTAFMFMGFGFARFFVEYLREPDSHLGFVVALGPGDNLPQLFTSFLNLSMGQILSLFMILAGAAIFVASYILNKKQIALDFKVRSKN